jgi:superoxide dismutase, Fe-Mn family
MASESGFKLPELPWARDALAPHISERTIDFHYGKHHAGYVNKLNAATEGSELASKSLEELIKTQQGKVFNCAAQTWNHTFYWNSMKPNGGGQPSGELADAIKSEFGSFEAFKEQFSTTAATHFGSGWAWLVKNADGKLAVVGTHDAGNPLVDGQTPLLTIDIWEHAYYLDYQNARATYIETWWKLVNWDFVAANFAK